MTTYKKQLFSVLSAGVMLLNVATPALAGTEIVISGNGAGSDNFGNVTQSTTTVVSQDNNANVDNIVYGNANSGNNDANYNTGGDVAIKTGSATSTTNIENDLNTNQASVDCCNQGDTEVEISGNGAYSDNVVVLNTKNKTIVKQDNYANVDNIVHSDANTGGNDANSNTGGDVVVWTGSAMVDTNISTTANVNSASVGSAQGASNPSASFIISGNGAGSDNYITAKLDNFTKVDQENDAWIDNIVKADADSGYNDANFNTGGDVLIKTGAASVDVDVDNAVNFNSADVDCGCTWDVLAKIIGNGADPDQHEPWFFDEENVIALTLESDQLLFQDNYANLDNKLWDLDADTGKNDAELNTGEAGDDPAILTGDASVNAGVNNSGNVNVIGDLPFDFPEMPEVEVSFNWAAFFAFFGMSM